jgi:nucleoid-associated protein YgaU
MQVVAFSREPSSCRRRVTLFVLLSLFFCSGYVRAQDSQGDVADAARQERARKSTQQNATHVYTDEDLKREKILVPADQARVEARKKRNKSTAGQQNAEARPVTGPTQEDPAKQTESLGEVARRYRAEKAAREAEQAAAKSFSSFPQADPKLGEVLAEPKPEIAPLVSNGAAPAAPMRKHIEVNPQAAPRTANHENVGRLRISPFQPRPLLARPSVPVVPAPRIAPAAPTVRVAPIQPKTGLAPAVPTTRETPAAPKMNLTPAEPRTNVAPVEPKPPANDRAVVTNAIVAVVQPDGTRRIQVQRGDSWWKLARRYLGSGARWPELRSLNPATNEPAEALRQGSLVFVPESATAQSAPVRRIVVRKGDTLWALARTHLGHASAWSCLASANPEVSEYTRLSIGTTLRLPSSEALRACGVSLTRGPRD